MYAILKSAEFYNGKTEQYPMVDNRDRVAVYATRADAQDAADAADAGDCEAYGCPMLEHGQASSWQYSVRRVRSLGDTWHGVRLPD